MPTPYQPPPKPEPNWIILHQFNYRQYISQMHRPFRFTLHDHERASYIAGSGELYHERGKYTEFSSTITHVLLYFDRPLKNHEIRINQYTGSGPEYMQKFLHLFTDFMQKSHKDETLNGFGRALARAVHRDLPLPTLANDDLTQALACLVRLIELLSSQLFCSLRNPSGDDAGRGCQWNAV